MVSLVSSAGTKTHQMLPGTDPKPTANALVVSYFKCHVIASTPGQL